VKKKSKHRPIPREFLPNPLQRLQKTPRDKAHKELARYHSALTELMHSRAPSEESWRDSADVVNLVTTMMLHKGKLLRSEVEPALLAATESMKAAATRHLGEGKPLRLDAHGIAGLREVIDMWAQCLEGYTQQEIAECRAECARRCRAVERDPQRVSV
jgi:hypothetical protein